MHVRRFATCALTLRRVPSSAAEILQVQALWQEWPRCSCKMLPGAMQIVTVSASFGRGEPCPNHDNVRCTISILMPATLPEDAADILGFLPLLAGHSDLFPTLKGVWADPNACPSGCDGVFLATRLGAGVGNCGLAVVVFGSEHAFLLNPCWLLFVDALLLWLSLEGFVLEVPPMCQATLDLVLGRTFRFWGCRVWISHCNFDRLGLEVRRGTVASILRGLGFRTLDKITTSSRVPHCQNVGAAGPLPDLASHTNWA